MGFVPFVISRLWADTRIGSAAFDIITLAAQSGVYGIVQVTALSFDIVQFILFFANF